MKRFALLFAATFFGVLPSHHLLAQAAASPSAPADLVQQVQAADLLADLITYTVDRADTRIKDAQAYLQSNGKMQAYQQNSISAQPTAQPLNYMLLFKGSLAFVEGDGAKYADQSVSGEPVAKLYEDLTAAQYYNMHEFLHFNQQRQEFASMQAYLQSIGEYDKFLASTSGNAAAERPGAKSDGAQPTPTTPQEVAQRMGGLIQFIYETAWQEAKAKGTSQADFDKQWPEQVKAYRQSVMAKIEESQPNGGGFGRSEVAGTPLPPTSAPAQATASATPPQVIYAAPPTDLGANRQLPPPVNSPYSNGMYRSRDQSLWNMWDFNRRY